MKGKNMPIYKTKNNTYYVRIYQNGKQKTKRGFKTKKQAEQYEAALILQNEDTLQKIENKEPGIRFKSIYEKFMQLEKKRLKSSTYYNNKYIMDKNILKYFKSKNINTITVEILDDWYQEISKLNFTHKYKNRLLGMLNNIFEYATLYYNLENKVKYLPSFTNNKIAKTTNNKIYTLEQFRKFENSIINDVRKTFFQLLFYTGLRIGEARALTWNDVDFSNNAISINKAAAKVKGGDTILPPKTLNSIRRVFIPKTLYNSLEALYERKKRELLGFKESWFIFGDVKMISQTTVDRWNREAAQKSNLFRIKIHAFRHSYITMMILKGIEPKILQKQVGHSSISTTLDIYTHISEEIQKKKVLNIFDEEE